SASLWVRLRAAPQLPPGKLLVLADPSGGSAAQAILRDSTGVFGALVHARREAEVALSAFPSGSELRTGAPASESFLKSARLDGVSLLPLATHAVVDERDPEHAAVVLAPGSEAEDGRLEPQEIGRLPLRGRTVVLAGCETSAGPVYRGEGVMSLARAFFGAGASAVVGTLDRARDDEAGGGFSSLYPGVGPGGSPGGGLVGGEGEGVRARAAPAARRLRPGRTWCCSGMRRYGRGRGSPRRSCRWCSPACSSPSSASARAAGGGAGSGDGIRSPEAADGLALQVRSRGRLERTL